MSLVRAAPSPPAVLPAALCKAEALIVPAISIFMWNDLTAVPLESAWVIIELGSLGLTVATAEEPGAFVAPAGAPVPLAPVVAALLPQALATTTTSPANSVSAGLGSLIKVDPPL